MRLWGIADEPFWPALNGSWSSPISVCWRLRISVAKRSSEPPTIAIAVSSAAWRSRWTIWVLTGSTWSRARPAPRPRGPGPGGCRSRPARDLARPDLVDGGCQTRRRPRSISNAQPASLSPKVVGSAWTEWVRPIITVAGLGAGAGDHDGEQAVHVEQEAPAGGSQLEREARVDIAAGQPEMEEATLGADRLGDLADEGDDVVVGRPLDLGDPVDVDARARLERDERVGRDLAAGHLGPGDRQLDPEHRLEAGGVGPDRAHLRERVAGDHRALTAIAPAEL